MERVIINFTNNIITFADNNQWRTIDLTKHPSLMESCEMFLDDVMRVAGTQDQNDDISDPTLI